MSEKVIPEIAVVGIDIGKITTAMRNLTSSLQAVRRCSGDDDFSHLCCAASEAYGEVRRNSRMRVLTGLSPDESTLILVFASPCIGECMVQPAATQVSHVALVDVDTLGIQRVAITVRTTPSPTIMATACRQLDLP